VFTGYTELSKSQYIYNDTAS